MHCTIAKLFLLIGVASTCAALFSLRDFILTTKPNNNGNGLLGRVYSKSQRLGGGSSRSSFAPRVIRLSSDNIGGGAARTSTRTAAATGIIKSRDVTAMGNANCCESYEHLYWKEKRLWEKEDCELMAPWQRQTYSTCNTIHETPLAGFYGDLLGMSGHKVAWLLQENDLPSVQGHNNNNNSNDQTKPVGSVFRTQRYHQERIFDDLETPVMLDEHRFEALATERLTSSPHTIDLYQFCGNSFVGEIGYEKLHEKYVIKDKQMVTNQKRLELGYEAAIMLAELHSIDTPDGTRPTMTHGDFTTDNILVAADGTLKMIDFGEGLAMKASKSTGEICKVRNLPAPNVLPTQNKPPERFNEDGGRSTQLISYEKVDVYSLGIILIELLEGIKVNPFFLNVKKQSQLLSQPRILPIDQEVYDSRDTNVMALLYSSLACFTYEPHNRPTANRIANGLATAKKWIKQGKTTSTVDEIKSLFQDDPHLFADLRVKEGGGGGDDGNDGDYGFIVNA